MTDQAVTADIEGEDEDLDVEAQQKKKGLPGKKLVLFIVLPVLLLGGGAAGAYFSGLLNPLLGISDEHAEGAEAEPEESPSVFHDLPELLVNLNSTGRKSSFLKLSISLELEDDATIDRLKEVMPRIIDNFQVYLRELRIEDLSGSAGLERLREELLLRVNAAVRPAVVRDVLFKEMLVQ
jgi:flagellar FliL protein